MWYGFALKHLSRSYKLQHKNIFVVCSEIQNTMAKLQLKEIDGLSSMCYHMGLLPAQRSTSSRPQPNKRKYSLSMAFYCNNIMHLHHSALYLEFVRLFDGQCWCHPSAAPVLIINTLYTPSRNIHTSYRCLLPSAPSALGKRDGCIRRSPYFPPFIFYFFPILWGLTSVSKHLNGC